MLSRGVIVVLLAVGIMVSCQVKAGDDTVLIERVLPGVSLVLQGGELVKLHGIRVPYRHSALAPTAQEALRVAVDRQQVRVRRVKHGSGLPRVHLFVSGRDVGLELVRSGHAWCTTDDWQYWQRCIQEERTARDNKRGVWAWLNRL